MFFKGFKFGLLLQIAIGPVFIFVLKTATESGIRAAEAAVLAATLVDALFVLLAVLGIGKLIDKKGFKTVLKYFGIIILIYFGAGTLLGALDIHIIPGMGSLAGNNNTSNSFLLCLVLTASNPLTILFWTGVFASKISTESFNRKDMYLFGAGAVMTTLVFLGAVAFLAGLLEPIMTEEIIKVLNITVGLVLIAFSVRMLVKEPEAAAKENSIM
ncbi:MAG: putative threonine efflux protein [Eubacterium sp.]|jgi:threonine/homoserine/homoserine lactone efflux protein|nr:putative threonine efflux protein [Eubacterium sp.]